MPEDTTTATHGKLSPPYRVGDVIVFKYEGNLRARVTGGRVIDDKLWLDARCPSLSFLVPSSLVVAVEPDEEVQG